MLIHIPALFSPEEVREARALLDAADWQDGRATAGHRAALVKRNLQLPLDHAVTRQLGARILDRLGATPLFIAATLPLRVLPPRFNRYEGGGEYGAHVDNAIFPLPGSADRVRSDVSSTLFFSDPHEYDDVHDRDECENPPLHGRESIIARAQAGLPRGRPACRCANAPTSTATRSSVL